MGLTGDRLAGSNSIYGREKNDFYTTDPMSVRCFLNALMINSNCNEIFLGNTIWECACGTGNITNEIKEFYPTAEIYSSDLVERGFGAVEDFLQSERKADVIITNPPFSLLNEFIIHGLEQTNRFLILFAKIQTLETKARAKILKDSPLRYVYVHTQRQATWRNNNPYDKNGKRWTTTMCMAWFIWDKEYKGDPIIRFI